MTTWSTQCLLSRVASRARIHDFTQFWPLPLRTEHPLLCGVTESRGHAVGCRPHSPRSIETHVNYEKTGSGTLKKDLLRCCYHRETALRMAEEILGRDDDGQVFDRSRPDQIAPCRPKFPLVGAGRQKDQFGAAQRQCT